MYEEVRMTKRLDEVTRKQVEESGTFGEDETGLKNLSQSSEWIWP